MICSAIVIKKNRGFGNYTQLPQAVMTTSVSLLCCPSLLLGLPPLPISLIFPCTQDPIYTALYHPLEGSTHCSNLQLSLSSGHNRGPSTIWRITKLFGSVPSKHNSGGPNPFRGTKKVQVQLVRETKKVQVKSPLQVWLFVFWDKIQYLIQIQEFKKMRV